MDACTWLLDNGVDPAEIAWIKPRETWALDRAYWQPREQVGRFMIGWAASIEAAATATSIPDLFGRLEECGHLCRVDNSVEPTMYRAGTLSGFEIEQLRSIEQVVRAGRVRRIQPDRIGLEGGDVATRPDRLHVDCTAEGLGRPPSRPIFEPHRVTIQQVRETSPTFNAALIGYLEATRHDVDEQNALAPPNAYPDVATDWMRIRQLGLMAQNTWDRTPDVAEWLEASRLNISAGVLSHAGEPGVGAAIGTYLEHRDRAIENLTALRAQIEGG